MPAFGEHRKAHYPGVIPAEATLWRLWLIEHEAYFDRFDYNVLVGDGIPANPLAGGIDPVLAATLERRWRELTQKRIDAVGYAGDEATIFEIEERPGPRALGQLLTYSTLLPRILPAGTYVNLVAIVRRISPDMLAAFEEAGIEVFQVTPPPG